MEELKKLLLGKRGKFLRKEEEKKRKRKENH